MQKLEISEMSEEKKASKPLLLLWSCRREASCVRVWE